MLSPIKVIASSSSCQPDLWDSFLSLQSHADARIEDEETAQRMQNVFVFIDQELQIPGMSVALVNQICGILDTNSFEVPSGGGGGGGTIQAVYSVTCLTEHNCIPNLHRYEGRAAYQEKKNVLTVWSQLTHYLLPLKAEFLNIYILRRD